MSRYVMRLFVTGRSHRSELAVANLQRVGSAELDGEFELEIIDVLERPDLAEEARIIATPTLLKIEPPPARRIIGDLSDEAALRMGLDLAPASDSEVRS